ncbi:hypothetical protein [Streptomyces sp. NPDC001250]|uniref:hypothetical protein n=1 Tax=unclassified Streptomyces TaxID=2593676 RepID=UPI00332C4267
MTTATPRPPSSVQLPGDHVLLRAVDLDRIAWFEAVRHRHATAVHAYALTCVAQPELARYLSAHAFSRLRDQVSRGSRAATGLQGTCLRVELLTSVRRAAVEIDPHQLSSGFRMWVSYGALWPLDDDCGLVQSYQRLPAVDRCLLWHTQVEYESPDVVADVTGLSRAQLPNRCRSALAALRRAQAALHLQQGGHTDCLLHGEDILISAYLPVHGDAHAHLRNCATCRTVRTRLNLLRSSLANELPRRLLGWWPGEAYRGYKNSLAGTADTRPGTSGGTLPGAPRQEPLKPVPRHSTGADGLYGPGQAQATWPGWPPATWRERPPTARRTLAVTLLMATAADAVLEWPPAVRRALAVILLVATAAGAVLEVRPSGCY